MGIADGGLRSEFRKRLIKPRWHFSPIETRGTRNGVPDTFFVNRDLKVSGWIEFKKTDGWAVKLEPMQVSWLMIHARASVPCYIAVRATGSGSSAGRGDSLWLLNGIVAEQLQDEGLRWFSEHRADWGSNVRGIWLGPPREWNWSEIGSALTHS